MWATYFVMGMAVGGILTIILNPIILDQLERMTNKAKIEQEKALKTLEEAGEQLDKVTVQLTELHEQRTRLFLLCAAAGITIREIEK